MSQTAIALPAPAEPAAPREWMRLCKASEKYGVSVQVLRRWGRAGTIHLHRLPGARHLFVDALELDRVIESHPA